MKIMGSDAIYIPVTHRKIAIALVLGPEFSSISPHSRIKLINTIM